ncbi:n19m, NADH-ubiquinone oxidoreductase 9.5 kDa subunit [Ophidiomyces ophidiicola]|nr:n19m, NADH-ubiquinone oxidoreductase 9.5 kDa subunit [Ophidiomyces ophidiicola]KAI1922022.1 n19m, NADH-ubiquinone oxidoreductase 9.5 kDa subunit [Ophidiomyces ophidiicola]KAI1950031.1 n19m, NADH-ubiquinone oxidoreductase 9.5 kDa subunit [Ophidiomyces ophidiicola]KAI2026627.1 n19m, NADH-ubiquinone oxidoreductase 9.5 kDa subunit [Ophidiomyces ophidiicola]KAI2101524.1 n19m, NADH-ubiquinone oxidoreductase 9.5 kDa subunit [Ophidiomyces ophidiicola]
MPRLPAPILQGGQNDLQRISRAIHAEHPPLEALASPSTSLIGSRLYFPSIRSSLSRLYNREPPIHDPHAMSKPVFWSTPIRYMRWAAIEKPAIFYSIVMGSLGPVALVTLPPIRRYFGDVDPPPVPLSYPIPPGPRKIPEGYDDE